MPTRRDIPSWMRDELWGPAPPPITPPDTINVRRGFQPKLLWKPQTEATLSSSFPYSDHYNRLRHEGIVLSIGGAEDLVPGWVNLDFDDERDILGPRIQPISWLAMQRARDKYLSRLTPEAAAQVADIPQIPDYTTYSPSEDRYWMAYAAELPQEDPVGRWTGYTPYYPYGNTPQQAIDEDINRIASHETMHHLASIYSPFGERAPSYHPSQDEFYDALDEARQAGYNIFGTPGRGSRLFPNVDPLGNLATSEWLTQLEAERQWALEHFWLNIGQPKDGYQTYEIPPMLQKFYPFYPEEAFQVPEGYSWTKTEHPESGLVASRWEDSPLPAWFDDIDVFNQWLLPETWEVAPTPWEGV